MIQQKFFLNFFQLSANGLKIHAFYRNSLFSSAFESRYFNHAQIYPPAIESKAGLRPALRIPRKNAAQTTALSYLGIMETNETPVSTGIGSRVSHNLFGRGVIVDQSSETYTVWFKSQQGTRNVAKDFSGMKVTEVVPGDTANGQISLSDIEEALETVLERKMHEFQLVPLGPRWDGGTLIMQPKDSTLQSKEIPIDTFFHKIVMIRDRVRLIEQKINANKTLTASEKVDIQQYVTGIYGSLTTFNVLFKEQHHQFKGSSKD